MQQILPRNQDVCDRMWHIVCFASVLRVHLHFESASIDRMMATRNQCFQYIACQVEEHPPCRVRLARHIQERSFPFDATWWYHAALCGSRRTPSRPLLSWPPPRPTFPDLRHAADVLQDATCPPPFSTRTPPRARHARPPPDHGPDCFARTAARIAVAIVLYAQAQRFARPPPPGGAWAGGGGAPPPPPGRPPPPPLCTVVPKVASIVRARTGAVVDLASDGGSCGRMAASGRRNEILRVACRTEV